MSLECGQVEVDAYFAKDRTAKNSTKLDIIEAVWQLVTSSAGANLAARVLRDAAVTGLRNRIGDVTIAVTTRSQRDRNNL